MLGDRRRCSYTACALVCSTALVLGGLTSAAHGTASAAPDARALKASGRLDPTFGRAGTVRTSFGPRASAGIRELLVDAKDRIIAIGSLRADAEAAAASGPAGRDVTLVRYLANGALDSSFGKNGKVIHDVRGLDDVATDAAQLPGGRIVVVGATDSVPAPDRQDLMVLRFLQNGELDRTFGADGLAVADLSPATPDLDFGFGVAIQKDGKIVVVGQTSLIGTERVTLGIARFLPNGSLDLAFGTRGVVRPGTGPSRVGQAVLVRSDGRILVGGDDGSTGGRTFVARFRSTGAVDMTFGAAGFAAPPRGSLRALLVADKGATLALGGTQGTRASAFIVRLDGRGRFDRSFGVKGRMDVPVAAGRKVTGATSGAVQPDGKIVLAGANGDDILVARCSPNGRPDRAFGGTGVVTVDVGGRFDYASAVALGRGGRIAAAGDSSGQPYGPVESVLVRLLGAGRTGTVYAGITAANRVEGVAVRWETAVEPDVRGYVVYRSTGDSAARKRLTRTPIAARRHPARYAFIDRSPPDYAPLYWLEELRRDGTRALFGPIIPPEAPTTGG